MTQALLLAGLCTWAFGAAVDLLLGARQRLGRTLPFLAGALGGGCVCAAGVLAVLGSPVVVDLGSTLGMGRTIIRVDPLAGLFLTFTAGLAVPISGCLASWARPPGRLQRRGVAAAYLLLLGAVAIIVVAGDAFTFLFGWESLTVAFYILTGIQRRSRRQARAAWLTFAVGKLSGAALLFGFLLVAGHTGTDVFAGWSGLGAGPVDQAAWALIVVGFGAKVGLVPLQVWLPVGYPAAPGPTRAALAGLATNVGFYGLWRFLGVLGRPPVWLAVVVLLLGGVTALVGIVFAAVQSELGRVIAYSSVENAGVIAVGYGVALAGAATHQTNLVAIGLLAASLQVLAHGVAKTGLFSAAAFFVADWGTERLDDLSGVIRTHRWSGTAFSLGSLTLAGLPPTIGFVSEWFILEALLQEFRISGLPLRMAMAVAGALVALTAGVAAFCFIRLLGLTVLSRGNGRAPDRGHIDDGGVIGRAALVVIASGCVALAAFAPWVVRYIAHGLTPLVPAGAVTGALKSPWVLQPVYANFSILSPSWLVVVMMIGFAAVGAFAWLASRGRVFRLRRVPAWRSATAGVAGADRYTSFGYANAVRHVLGNILGTRRSQVDVVEMTESGVVESAHIDVRSTVIEPIETYLYRPTRQVFLWMVGISKRLQSGRLDAYIAYMLATLLVVLAVAAAAS